jgi:hypothetical protein
MSGHILNRSDVCAIARRSKDTKGSWLNNSLSNGFRTTIVRIIFRVTEETMSAVTEIPPRGERRSKGMPLDVLCYEYFIKPNCLNKKIRAGVSSRYLWESFQNLLKVIRRYFTCERRSERLYPHYIRLLMHFIGRGPLKLPFFLH